VEPALSSIAVVSAFVLLAVAGGVAYARRVRMDRPPIGVVNLRDIAVMSVVVVVLPPLYLHIPAFLIVVVLALVAAGVAYSVCTPVLGGRSGGALAVGLVLADIALHWLGADAVPHPVFLVVNNALMALLAIGVGTLYVQSGIKARDVAVFAVVLLVYDVLATVAFPTMIEFFARVVELPLTPAIIWGSGAGVVGAGLGDLLMIVLWTLAAEKAFGRRAGLLAAATGVGAVLLVFLAFWLDWLNTPVPAMVVLGPLIAVEYLALARRRGRERTTGEHLGLPPAPAPPERPSAALDAALDWLPADPSHAPGLAGRYVAIVDGRPVASGSSQGAAVRAAREVAPGRVPVLVWSAGGVPAEAASSRETHG
jgi:hypothetical protein